MDMSGYHHAAMERGPRAHWQGLLGHRVGLNVGMKRETSVPAGNRLLVV
jgi:hypothetical protein